MMYRLKALIKKTITLLNREIPTEILIKRGMKVGSNFNRQQGVYLDPSHCFLITIGNNVTMSIRVIILAHDASTKKMIGYTKIGKVSIGDNVFIGAGATILPNVSIGDNSIIGAGSLISHDVPSGVVVAGNPAKVICSVEDFTQKNNIRLEVSNSVFDENYRMEKGKLSANKVKIIQDSLNKNIGFIR